MGRCDPPSAKSGVSEPIGVDDVSQFSQWEVDGYRVEGSRDEVRGSISGIWIRATGFRFS